MTTVRLDDTKISQLIKDTKNWDIFPFFKTLSHRLTTAASIAKGGCSSCQAKKMAAATDSVKKALSDAKNFIQGLSSDMRTKLKQVLHADELRFTVKDATTGRFKEVRY